MSTATNADAHRLAGEKLLQLLRDQFGEAAVKIGYARDDVDIVLWDVRDSKGRRLWDARPDDIPEWEDLGRAVDLFAQVIQDNPKRGNRLIFDLANHQQPG